MHEDYSEERIMLALAPPFPHYEVMNIKLILYAVGSLGRGTYMIKILYR